MKKRIIAFIGAIVLCLSLFAVPAFAAEKEVDLVLDHKGMSQNGVEEYIGISFIVIDNVRVEYRDVDGNRDSIEYGRLIGKGCNYTFNSETHYGFSFNVCLPGQSYTVLNSFGSSINPSSDGIIILPTSPGNMMLNVSCRDICLFYLPSNVRFCVYDVATHFGFRGIDAFAPLDVDSARQEGYDAGYQAGVGSTDAYQEGFTDGVASIDQESIRQEGYVQGREEGYQSGYTDGFGSVNQEEIRYEGYESGYNDAMGNVGDLTGGLFRTMVLDLDVSVDVDGSTVHDVFLNVPFDLSVGGIYFKKTLSFLESTYGSTWEERISEVTLILHFYNDFLSGQSPFDWVTSPISISGSTLVESAQLRTVDKVWYSLTAQEGSYGDLRSFQFNDPAAVSYPLICDIFQLKVGRPGDLLNEITLWSNSQFYGTGYAAGYVDGLSAESGQVYDQGYADGYNEGFLGGKQEGLELSKNGDWKQLMLAVVEAPINTFQSLFNFEILGLDMRLAFGSILAVCVLLIIVKKVIL